ncbi:MAG: phage holin family protein [Eggerthellaceae bacterium]|nr:phage holin family protein [Eggerthellaceae bacterium]
MRFLIRWIVTALAVAVAFILVPGISYYGSAASWLVVVIFSLILSLIDMIIKPILQVLSFPITILTLGIFYLVVNTFLFYLASWISGALFGIDIYIASFWSAFFASIIISIVSTIANAIVGRN